MAAQRQYQEQNEQQQWRKQVAHGFFAQLLIFKNIFSLTLPLNDCGWLFARCEATSDWSRRRLRRSVSWHCFRVKLRGLSFRHWRTASMQLAPSKEPHLRDSRLASYLTLINLFSFLLNFFSVSSGLLFDFHRGLVSFGWSVVLWTSKLLYFSLQRSWKSHW